MKRWLFVFSSVVFAPLAGITACGFDEVTYADGALGEAGAADDATTAATDAAASTDGADGPHELLVDGSDPDALIAKDSGGPPIDAAGCAPSDCDCDKDGYKDTLKAGCGGGERDCDDSDPRTHPGQLFIDEPPALPQFGDWNCAGGVERLYATGFKCEGHLLGLGCDQLGGFETVPECGQEASFITCKTGLLDCVVKKRDKAKQHCR